jgi:hypothetical protein
MCSLRFSCAVHYSRVSGILYPTHACALADRWQFRLSRTMVHAMKSSPGESFWNPAQHGKFADGSLHPHLQFLCWQNLLTDQRRRLRQSGSRFATKSHSYPLLNIPSLAISKFGVDYPLGAWSWRPLLPLRVGGASRRSAPVFPCLALVRVSGLVFSVAGWCCCPALRFSVACLWTRTMLCLARKKKYTKDLPKTP